MGKEPATLEAARAAKAAALSRFGSVAGVNGIGLSRRGGGYALKINLESELDVEIPDRIEGVEVIVEVVGKLRKLSARAAVESFHVLPQDGGWAVRREGAQRSSSVHETQRQATAVARRLARRVGGELLIHSRDGSVRQRKSYG